MTWTSARPDIRRMSAAVWFVAFLFGIEAGATRADAQTHAYVANTTADAVTVLDTATNTVIGTIAVGTAPAEVAVTRDAARVYVTNTGSNSVSVIDTVTRTVVATVPVGDRPSGIAVAPGGDRVYVLGAGGVLEVIDAGTNAVVASVAVGGTDGTVAITPDGSRLYVASGNVSVVDTATGTVIASFAAEAVAHPDVDNSAVAVAISPDGGRAYVSVVSYHYDFQGFRADGGIAVIDTATNAVTQTIPLHSLPGSIAFTRDGSRAYVGIEHYWADTGYGAAFFPGRWVAAIDAVTNAAIAWADLGAEGALWNLQHTPAGLAVTPDRTGVYVSIPVINSVAAIDTATNLMTSTIAVAAGPSGLVVLPDPSVTSSPFLIDAVNDTLATPLVASSAGPAVANVLANDSIGEAPAAVGNVDLSTVSSSSAGVTLDPASGGVWVAADTAFGTHTLVYQICEVGNPDNCDQAMVTLTVRAPKVIDAADDRATSFPGRSAIADVTANDSLDGSPAVLTETALVLVSSSDPGITLDLASGSVSVAAGTAVGDHALVYRICEIASPANCDAGTVTVTVVPYVIRAENDSATVPRTGGTAVTNVLANDTLDGTAATLARVAVSQISATAAGITLDAATASVHVAQGTAAGVQTLVYRICELANAANCSDSTVTVTVTPYVVSAVPDQARASSKIAGTAIASVLANDSLGDVQASTANVSLALVSMTPFNGKIRLDLSDGSVDVLGKTSSGLYTLVYEICELESPTNCARATVSLELSGRN